MTGNFPVEVTTFVGRRRELDELRRLVGEARLVTLVGPGGIGKTRLAVRAGSQLRRAFGDGVWFVDLTALRAPDLLYVEVQSPNVLAYAMMTTLGVREHPDDGSPIDQLVRYLAGRQMLVVLDNCEHLVPACAVLADTLVRGCPRLRVLATSREPLMVHGEVIFPVPPLRAPDPGEPVSLARVSGVEAVALFAARAQAAMPDFVVTEHNAAAVAELCRRLDGLPLAIELAAHRVRVLSPEQILDRLVGRFALLARGNRGGPERQQTLRACVDWSFELCAKPERLLWARMAVFADGCELDAIEEVCADELLPSADVLEVVSGLVDKSILIRDDEADAGQARYRLLETLRDYGQDQLCEAGEQEELRRRHRAWCQRLVEQGRQEWVSPRQGYWAARLRREYPNLRAAVESALAEPGQAEAVLRLTVTVPDGYWRVGGMYREVRGWLERALAHADAVPTALRARAQLLASEFSLQLGDLGSGERLLKQAEPLAQRLDPSSELAHAVWLRGWINLRQGGNSRDTIDFVDRALAILARLPQPNPHLHLGLLTALGHYEVLGGDTDRAEAACRQILAITGPRGEFLSRSWALWIGGLVAWRRGDLQEATTLEQESLRLRASFLNARFDVAHSLEALAWIAASRQHHHRAATLLGAADALRADLGVSKQPSWIGHHQACAQQARDALGEAAFDAAFAHGRHLPYDEVIGYALDDRRQPAPSPAPAPAASMPLTRREQQVADLIAQGLSNKEIAAKLVVSQRTAESHVEHILTKLGFTSRAQVAAWLAAQRSGHQPAN